jgi:putative N6-adenine-specific DNA methylase
LKILVKTLFGLEDILAHEIENLGAKNVKIAKRAVHCEGDIRFLYAANFQLRTAMKIIVPIRSFTANSDDELYREVSKVDWSKYIRMDQTFAIDNTIFSSIFRHSKFVSLKTKDAIADQFKSKFGKRPSVDIKSPDIQIDIHCKQDQFTISMDSSGDTLNRRGYRVKGHAAPLNEALAAGMVKMTGWNGESPLVDPMCGTGTILIEAAMIALNIPPQLRRDHFAFMNWPNFNAALWSSVKAEAMGNIEEKNLQILGADQDKRILEDTARTIENLKLQNHIKLKHSRFERLQHDFTNGFLITNPPYGERMDSVEINGFYKYISDVLKNNFQGFEAWVLSSNLEAFKHLRLKPSKKIILYNGPLECRFQKYELYSGTKRSTV